MIDLEKWIEENSVTMQLNPKHRGVLVDDLRALFAGKVLCDAGPVAWRVFDGEGNYDAYLSDGNQWCEHGRKKYAGTLYEEWYEPLYAAAKER